MRILLDECVNPRVRAAFPEQFVETVQSMNWSGITNGKLLALAQRNQFDVFVTVDRNLEYQHKLASLTLGIIVVTVPDNNIRHFKPLFVELRQAAESIAAGRVVHVNSTTDR